MRNILITGLLAGAIGTGAIAAPPDGSTRPEARPAFGVVGTAAQVTKISADLSKPLLSVTRSLRPRLRPAEVVKASVVAAEIPEAMTNEARGFVSWVSGFRGRALAQGISARTFDTAFATAHFLPDVIKRDRSQSEFTLSVGDYLGRTVSDLRIDKGRDEFRNRAATLNGIAGTYGVDPQYVAAIWGMESNFGSHRGSTHLVSALATLAYEGRRGAFFESQLIAALQILQSGDVDASDMTGSWAGAMGHTQFIPTSYLSYAVDYTGDGRRDIWSDDPTDALASTAAYLAKSGWIKGMPWGVEVRLPQGFDFAEVTSKRMPSDWARLGVTGADGRAVPDYGSARLLLPAGASGLAFLVFKNFDVIKRYNNSDAYALAVGHLGDRIAGGPAFRGQWPANERALKRDEREELQALLTRRGFSTGGVDGRIGPNTVDALRAYQVKAGLTADGHASVDVLQHLRRN